MPEKSAYDYWLGLCQLWSWIGKSEKPPRPHKMSSQSESPGTEESDDQASLCFTEFSLAIKSVRQLSNMPVLKLANLSGCDPVIIKEIETGQYGSVTLLGIQNLLRILNINLTFQNT
jgi:ribosome-binding protein aMBF1 (putative translation factor)